MTSPYGQIQRGDATISLLPCINLAAQACLKAIGSVTGIEYKNSDSSDENFQDMEEDGWGTRDSDFNEEELDPKSIIHRVR